MNVLPETKISLALSDQLPVLSVSDSIQEMLGFTADDFIAARVSLKDRIHPDDSDISDVLFSPVSPGKSGSFNIRIRQANGRIRCIRGYYEKRSDAGGSEVILELLLHDAKSLKRTLDEAVLMPNFRAMMDNTDDYIYFKDRNHVFTGASQTLVSLCHPAEHWTDLIGQTDYDVFPEEYADIYYRLEKQVFAGIPVAHEIQETLTNDGRKGWVDNRKYPINDENGNIIGLYGIARDISEIKHAEAKALLNEARLKSLVSILQYQGKTIKEFLDNALNEALKLTDSTIGYIYFYNEERQEFELNTWSNDVMKDCSVVDYQTIYHLDKTGIWGEAVRQRRPIIVNDFSAPNSHKKGYPEGHVHLASFMTVPVFSNDRIVAVVGVANKQSEYDEDNVLQLTLLMNSVWQYVENIRGEEERANLEARLHQAQKMESIGRLAGGVAHDFNNKLLVILGNAEVAGSHLNNPERIKDHLHEITLAAEHSRTITGQLLAFSRQQVIMPRMLDANRVIAEAQKSLSLLTGEHVSCTFVPADGLWSIRIDPVQLDQIIMNLAVNARDAMPEGGEFVIETGNVTIDEKQSKALTDGVPGEYVKITFRDTGTGISENIITRIFDPFFTTKDQGKGTGLGLATIYGIIRQNKGFIDVKSSPGQGTTFMVYFPGQQAAEGETVHNNLLN